MSLNTVLLILYSETPEHLIEAHINIVIDINLV